MKDARRREVDVLHARTPGPQFDITDRTCDKSAGGFVEGVRAAALLRGLLEGTLM